MSRPKINKAVSTDDIRDGKGRMSPRDQRELQDMRRAFHASMLVGEELLRDHKISWGAFSLFMIAFEEKLRQRGDEF